MEIKEKIREWLLEEDMYKEEMSDKSANFHFLIECPPGHYMDVIQPLGKSDVIIVGCATKVSPEHVQKLRDLNRKERREFMWDIKFSLNKFLVDFEIQENDDVLQGYVVRDVIYKDGLSKDKLMSTIKRVFKAKLHVLWKIHKECGEDIEKGKESDRMYV